MALIDQPRTPDALEGRMTPPVEPENEIPTARRQISLVERLELPISTSRLSTNAVVMGDIDNDPQKVRFLTLFGAEQFVSIKTTNQ